LGNKGSNTTTTQSGPNPVALSAYYNTLGQAQQVAGTPYQAYGGQLVAPTNQQQQLGIGGINQYANFAQPDIQQAENYANQAAQPITAQQIQGYESPYTQDVVNATENQFQNTNAQQQQQVLGNAAAQGALGGNRSGVAQAVLAGQQQTAEAPVIAGWENQGYNTAEQTALAEQQNMGNAAYSLGNLGVAGQNAGLTGANAQVGAGTLEQQTQQAQDTAAYQQYEQALAYPFQTTQWLAGIESGLGSQMGGQSETTGPAPNMTGQYLGAGLGALALLAARGGRIKGYDTGGSPYGGGVTPYGAGLGWVPTISITGGPGAPKPPNAPNQQQQGTQNPLQMMSQASQLANGLQGNSFLNNLFGSSPSYGGGNILSGDAYGGSSASPLEGLDASDYGIGFARGGAPIRLKALHRPPVRAGFGLASFVPRHRGGFADGGAPDDESDFDDRFQASKPGPDQTNYSIGQSGDPLSTMLAFQMYGQQSPYAPSPQGQPSKSAPADDALPPEITAGQSSPPMAPQDATGPSLGYAGDVAGSSAPTPQGQSAGTPGGDTASRSGLGLPSLLGLPQDVKMSLLSAGLGMLANRSPFLGVAIGEGGLQGLSTYGQLQQQHLAQQKQQQDVDLKVKELNQQAKAEQDKIAAESRPYSEMTANEKAELGLKQAQAQYEQNKGVNLPPGGTLVNPSTGKVIATNESGLMTDPAVDLIVDRIHAGDPSALTNLGRGAQTGVNLTRIQNRLAERAAQDGWSGADLAAARANFTSQAAAAATAAKREANVESSVEEAKNTFPLAIKASADLPRSDWVPLNKLEQMIQSGTSDPRYITYNTALQGAMTAYAQAMSRTGTNSVYAQQSAHDLLSKATGHEGIVAALDQMQREMQAAQVAPEAVRQAILGRISGRGTAAPTAMPGATAPVAAPAAAAPPAQRVPGQVYPTPKGPMKWTGTGWLPAQ
jgi:hypothetical protein